MPNQTAERLRRLSAKIMHTWEGRATKEVAAALPQTSLVLQTSLREFLDLLATALSTTIDRNQVRIKWDREQNTRSGQKHGRQRAETVHYTMDQLIFEYHILRQVICEVMEEETPLSPAEREVIVCAVEQAVNDAATQFSDTFRDIHEKVTDALAHDLRGPITAAKLSAQRLIKGPKDVSHCINIATRIISSMDRLDLMIQDLLDASRLRAGEIMNLTLAECDLEALLRQVANEANLLHGRRISLNSAGPVVGYWNENGLRRVIDNLISNALKFSPAASPITVKLQKSAQSAYFSVHNTGKPIPSEAQSSLFQQFHRAPTAEGKIGWGIGLTVVKGLAEAHGGSVDIESSAETGTSFCVVLPYAPDSAGEAHLAGK